MPPRHIVFLQGMPSPFFRRIGQALRGRGCRVTGINLCTGDWIFWHGPGTVHYRGTQHEWPRFFARFLAEQAVTDLVLLGEQRRYHRPAIALARAQGVRVTVTDFGYLRPDWITLEPDGMSGTSGIARDPERLRTQGALLPPLDAARRYSDSFWKMALGDLVYSLSNVFVFYLYPHYRRSDHRRHPLVYFPAMGLRLLTEKTRQRRARELWDAFAATGRPYFLFPLQLDHDFQIRAYSPFGGLGEAIETVLRAFAAHAPAGVQLIVKVHPWDPGLDNWARRIAQWSQALGMGGRITYVDGGDLDTMISGARGVVTVNSTAGLRALQLGRPVKTLGQAIYDLPGLTAQGALEQFWTAATPPDPALLEAFVRTVGASIQIRGVYFSEPGLSAAIQAAADRLFSATVGLALPVPAGDA